MKPRSIADWPTIERLFRETYDTIELEVGLDFLTQMSQQSMESGVSFLQCFNIQQAKCDFLLPEQEAIKLAIRGLEHRQLLKHHEEHFTSMGDLINKVGSYKLILNEMDEKANASKGTYVPGRNRTVGTLSLQSPTFDPYYQRQEETEAAQEYDDVGAVEQLGNHWLTN